MTKFLCQSLCALLLVSSTLAHWKYDRLILNGQIMGSQYQYIRRNNNSNGHINDVSSTDMRCNRGASASPDTQTLTVAAGSDIGFTIAKHFGHPGPQQVYISKAPGSVSEYDGSGGWARIYSLTTASAASDMSGNYYKSNTTKDSLKWASRQMDSFMFTLPSETPPGEYLLRAEGIALHAAHKDAQAQFYISCGQIKVIGNGTGTPGPLVTIPGWYAKTDPGVLIPTFWEKLKSYKTPGPALWPADVKEQHVLRTLPERLHSD